MKSALDGGAGKNKDIPLRKAWDAAENEYEGYG